MSLHFYVSPLVALTALLLAPLAHADEAAKSTAPSRATHWSADIGTARASAAENLSATTAESSVKVAAPHWSSRIGTGRATSDSSDQQRVAAADVIDDKSASSTPAPHWSSKIGTGLSIGS